MLYSSHTEYIITSTQVSTRHNARVQEPDMTMNNASTECLHHTLLVVQMKQNKSKQKQWNAIGTVVMK